MGKALVESVITMMQAMSPQSLSLQDTADGRQYVIELPAATASSGAAMFDLHQARAVIDERDLQHSRVRGARHAPEAGVRDFVQAQSTHDSPLGQRLAGRVLDRSGPWRHCHRGRWIRPIQCTPC